MTSDLQHSIKRSKVKVIALHKDGENSLNLFSADCSIFVQFGSYFDPVKLDVLKTFKVKCQRSRSECDVMGPNFAKLSTTQPGIVRFRSNLLQTMTT